MSEWRLYYDGGCNLCHVSKLRFETWAERAHQPLVAMPLQSPEGIAKGYGLEAMVLEADGVLKAEDAWIKLMTIAPWWLRWIGFLGKIPGARGILASGYRVVAHYRYRWFGTRECVLPPRAP